MKTIVTELGDTLTIPDEKDIPFAIGCYASHNRSELFTWLERWTEKHPHERMRVDTWNFEQGDGTWIYVITLTKE